MMGDCVITTTTIAAMAAATPPRRGRRLELQPSLSSSMISRTMPPLNPPLAMLFANQQHSRSRPTRTSSCSLLLVEESYHHHHDEQEHEEDTTTMEYLLGVINEALNVIGAEDDYDDGGEKEESLFS